MVQLQREYSNTPMYAIFIQRKDKSEFIYSGANGPVLFIYPKVAKYENDKLGMQGFRCVVRKVNVSIVAAKDRANTDGA